MGFLEVSVNGLSHFGDFFSAFWSLLITYYNLDYKVHLNSGLDRHVTIF